MSAKHVCSETEEPVGDDDIIAVGHSISDVAADEVAAPISDVGGDAVVKNGNVGGKKEAARAAHFGSSSPGATIRTIASRPFASSAVLSLIT
jgi:hypothetical protein